MITIRTTDHTYTADNGRLIGQIHHEVNSPTHWSDLCRVIIDYNPHRPRPEVSFHYGSGGINKGVSDLQVALAMAQAFAAAAALLADLNKGAA